MLEAGLFSVAALFYLSAICGERWQRTLKRWAVLTFFIALSIDASATIFVCIVRAQTLIPTTTHGWFGYAALVIMGVHAWWALMTLRRGGRYLLWFHRGSPIAGAIWIYAFISGIPR